jgi:RHS repeat-associated protein
MPAAAKEEMLASPNAEGSFSLAAGVAAALDTRDGANADRGEKSHQGIFSKNRRPRIGSTWLKWSGTHQDRSLAWSETMLGPTIYLYDGPNLLEEVDNSGNVLARYTQSGLIDEPLSELRASTPSYYEQDGINVVSSLSNSTGALTNTYTYDSFGKLTASSGTIANPFQYTSREFDPETGLLNYRARYYDPTVGRFLSEDPIGFHAGVNFYDYVLNRPTLFLDPTGLAGGPYGTYEKTRSWGSKIKCAIYLVYCTKNLQETRDSLDQMTDQAVTNTSDAMGNQGSYSNQRLKCGLSQDSNCQKALENCVKLALTNPFPPPSWMKDLMNYFSQPKSTQPAPPPTQP